MYFFLIELDVGTTEYADAVNDDDLSSTELPTTNIVPFGFFDDCYGPHNASMFWITRTEEGEKGRLYYSRIGYPEAMEGYITITNDDDPLQAIAELNSQLFVFSELGCFFITGSNPYTARPVAGVPGTVAPHTVVTMPHGICYAAQDGIRLFTGSQATLLIGFDAVKGVFRNESLQGINAFTPLVAAYARNEYMVSDGTQTLAVDVRTGAWRSYGHGMNALHYMADSDVLLGSLYRSSTPLDPYAIYALDEENTVVDGDSGSAVLFYVLEPPHFRPDCDEKSMVQWIFIDAVADVAPQTLTMTIILDGDETTTTTLTVATTRPDNPLAVSVNKPARVIGVRLSGDLTNRVEVFSVTAQIHVPIPGVS